MAKRPRQPPLQACRDTGPLPHPPNVLHTLPPSLLQTDNATKSVAINPHQFAVGGRGAANGAAPQCGGRTAAAGNAADKEQQPPEVAAA